MIGSPSAAVRCACARLSGITVCSTIARHYSGSRADIRGGVAQRESNHLRTCARPLAPRCHVRYGPALIGRGALKAGVRADPVAALPNFSPDECTNHLKACGYEPDWTDAGLAFHGAG